MTVFVCAVCKKDFKSKGQMSNHETSKAHKKKLKVGYQRDMLGFCARWSRWGHAHRMYVTFTVLLCTTKFPFGIMVDLKPRGWREVKRE